MSEESRTSAGDRSPRYPAISLPAAIEAIGKLWQKEKRTAVPAEVAVRAMGYNSLSGASRSLIAALRQYGLLESSGGSIAVSDVAVDILVHEPNSQEWLEAIGKAARAPEIFRELLQTHQDASDSAINAYVITRRRFSPDGARKLIRAFRETMALANRTGQGYSQAIVSSDSAHGDDMITPQQSGGQQSVAGQKVTVMQFPLGGGIRAEIRFIGGDPEPSHIERLEAYLKVTSTALETPS
jgi:hypothetical protein